MGDVRKDPRFGKNAPYHGMPDGAFTCGQLSRGPGEVSNRRSVGRIVLRPSGGGRLYGRRRKSDLVALRLRRPSPSTTRTFTPPCKRNWIERKQGEEASSRLALIVQSSDDAIVAKDLNGIITSWNPGAARIFGYAAEEVIGRSIYMLIPRGSASRGSGNPRARFAAGDRIEHYETVRRAKDGRLVDVSLTRVTPPTRER